MSRFQQAKYYEVFQKPHKRYILKKKEKPLWKPSTLKGQITGLSMSILFLSILSIPVFTQSIVVGYIVIVFILSSIVTLFVVGIILLNKQEQAKKHKSPISLSEFNSNSKVLNDISRVNIRAIRHVLGHLYSLNPCQLYPADTPEKLAYLTRTGRPPFAFELILGVAHRLSIPLNDEDVDQITENICNCPDVETLTVKLSRELEKRRGQNCENAIDIKQPLPEERTKVWKCVLWGCLLSGFLSLRIILEERGFTPTSIVSIIFFITPIGGLLGWGYAALGNRKPKKTSKEDENLLDMIGALGKYSEAGKYLYFFLFLLRIGDIVTIRESDPLPECETEELERMPLFSEICAYLKSAIDVEDRFYEQPIEGELVFGVRDDQPVEKQYSFSVTICDGIEDAYISFRRNAPEEEPEIDSC